MYKRVHKALFYMVNVYLKRKILCFSEIVGMPFKYNIQHTTIIIKILRLSEINFMFANTQTSLENMHVPINYLSELLWYFNYVYALWCEFITSTKLYSEARFIISSADTFPVSSWLAITPFLDVVTES